jgi:hypothetical protein
VLSLHSYISSLRHATPGKNIHSGITFGPALSRAAGAGQSVWQYEKVVCPEGIVSRVRTTAEQQGMHSVHSSTEQPQLPLSGEFFATRREKQNAGLGYRTPSRSSLEFS